MRHITLGRGWLLTGCALALLCLSQAALAQSGRRQKASSSPSPPPPAEAEAKDEAQPRPRDSKPAPSATVIVGGDRFNTSATFGSNYIDEAVESCTEDLNRSGGLEARGGGGMTRKEAVDRAKKETETYVLWLEMRVDGNRRDDVSVSYTLFSPQTAKVQAFGNVYLATRRVGRGPVGVGLPTVGNRMPLQYLMREAGRDVAGRVAEKLRAVARD